MNKHSMVGWKVQIPVDKGTPKDLSEAIKDALDRCMIEYRDEEVELVRAILRDFIAQKVTWAVLKCDRDQTISPSGAIMELFKKIVN
jgi:hypothetical protein